MAKNRTPLWFIEPLQGLGQKGIVLLQPHQVVQSY